MPAFIEGVKLTVNGGIYGMERLAKNRQDLDDCIRAYLRRP